jgi:SAM-dependent methyltransferase
MNQPEQITGGVKYLSDPNKFSRFEERYLALRRKENRLLSDEEVLSLPYLPSPHPHKEEWLFRADTMKRFLSYLKKKPAQGRIMELGCGNGWFTHKMAELTGHEVVGMDINILELEQSARVFAEENLSFCFGDIFEDIFNPKSFGMITLNASAQYFPDIIKLINRLLQLLKDNGEIHILDTHFYPDDKAAIDAAQRSKAYFTKLGFPEMAIHYHHHQLIKLKEIENISYEILYHNSKLKTKTLKLFRRRLSPFPWIRVRKERG